jgi:ketosteroid isomerase-like protein
MDAPPAESLLAQWFRRVWNEEDDAAIDELCTPDVVSHGLVEDIHGAKAWRTGFYEPMRAAFSKIHVLVMAETAQGDTVMGRMRATVTPRATGEETTMNGFCHVRVEGGRIAEAWDVWDFAGLMEGMRLLPRASFGEAISGRLAAHQAMAK